MGRKAVLGIVIIHICLVLFYKISEVIWWCNIIANKHVVVTALVHQRICCMSFLVCTGMGDHKNS